MFNKAKIKRRGILLLFLVTEWNNSSEATPPPTPTKKADRKTDISKEAP